MTPRREREQTTRVDGPQDCCLGSEGKAVVVGTCTLSEVLRRSDPAYTQRTLQRPRRNRFAPLSKTNRGQVKVAEGEGQAQRLAWAGLSTTFTRALRLE